MDFIDFISFLFALDGSAEGARANERIDNLPDAFHPKGTIGTDGDYPDLPTSGMAVGDTYFVATAGSYDGHAAKIGDMFYWNENSAWSYVPTGDVNTWRNVFVNGTEVQGIDNKDALKLVDSSSVKVNYDAVNKEVSFAGLEVKSFTYTGTGETTNVIQFTEIPKVILSIEGHANSTTYLQSANICWDKTQFGQGFILTGTSTNGFAYSLGYNNNDKQLTITGSQATRAFNASGYEYTVYYI